MAHSLTAGRGIGVVVLLVLVVSIATRVDDPTSSSLMPPVGVWEYRDSEVLLRLGVWPDYVQSVTTPLSGFKWLEDASSGVPAEKDGWPAIRLYEWVHTDWDNPGDTLETRFALGDAQTLQWSPGNGGSLLLLGTSPKRMTRLAPSPGVRRFAIETPDCVGRCSVFKLEVDAQGHVEYEGLRNVTRIGRYASEGGAGLFRTFERVASVARPDSIRYWCNGAFHGGLTVVAIDYDMGARVSHAAQSLCGAYDLFAKEAFRLLPTLELTPTTRPHRFITDEEVTR